MTRKDYVLLAEALKGARSSYSSATLPNVAIYHNGVDNAAHRVCEALARENAAFDRARFLKACGVES
jgi:hypothetical protein